MRHRAVALTVLLLSSGAVLSSQEPNPFAGATASLSRAEIARAMRGGSGWGAYRSDGTPRGDTTRQLAAIGAYDLEGSEPRGLVLFRAALERGGLPDSSFWHDARAAASLFRFTEAERAYIDRQAARMLGRSRSLPDPVAPAEAQRPTSANPLFRSNEWWPRAMIDSLQHLTQEMAGGGRFRTSDDGRRTTRYGSA